jgi:hypothetical protein
MLVGGAGHNSFLEFVQRNAFQRQAVVRLSISLLRARYYFTATQIRWIIGACWAWRGLLVIVCARVMAAPLPHGYATNRLSILESSSSAGLEYPLSSSENSSAAASQETESASSSRHVLPKNLDAAIKQLNDQELDRLVSVTLEERARRRKLFGHQETQRKREAGPVSLPQGKLNAVRAAFKAGVTPARIAREFGLARSDVQRALAGAKKL